YILGSTKTIPQSTEDTLAGYDVKRLAGDTRYDTNIEILKEAGVTDQEILVCSGEIFADSLSASAVGKPILLVNTKKDSLTAAQKEYLSTISTDTFYIIGSTKTISENLAADVNKYGSIERVWGDTRYETSIAVAERFFTNPDTVIFAGGTQYPDGLCGGALATIIHAPIILSNTGTSTIEVAKSYIQSNDVYSGIVLGADMHIDDVTAKYIFDVENIKIWE
ncbi:MAG: cell wall-binding repeat-containing protein, partial [Oscillospiraceae bacterium]|nr:cell wall-binding repeat-containing protein [Oscillospiraceae bacterium]